MIETNKLKNFNFVTIGEEQVIIYGEQEDEREEQSGSREEVPHVVIVKEVQHVTKLILVPDSDIELEKFFNVDSYLDSAGVLFLDWCRLV